MLKNTVHDEFGALVGADAHCALCIHQGKAKKKVWYEWTKKSWDGSTTNFMRHFETHAGIWAHAVLTDANARDPESGKKKEAKQTRLEDWNGKVYYNRDSVLG